MPSAAECPASSQKSPGGSAHGSGTAAAAELFLFLSDYNRYVCVYINISILFYYYYFFFRKEGKGRRDVELQDSRRGEEPFAELFSCPEAGGFSSPAPETRSQPSPPGRRKEPIVQKGEIHF